jgi:hypothetical protein
MCPTFYFDLSILIAFPHPMCHMLYIVVSTCDVLFYPMCHMFLFVLSIHISIFDLLFYHICPVLFCLVHSDCFLHPMFYILYSVMYNQAMLFFQCNMLSVCSVHPLIWGVLSTRRIKCTITNCLKSPVVIRYDSSQPP